MGCCFSACMQLISRRQIQSGAAAGSGGPLGARLVWGWRLWQLASTPLSGRMAGPGGSSGSTAHGIGPGSDTFTVRIGQDNYFHTVRITALGTMVILRIILCIYTQQSILDPICPTATLGYGCGYSIFTIPFHRRHLPSLHWSCPSSPHSSSCQTLGHR
jgi:hypothetical protein